MRRIAVLLTAVMLLCLTACRKTEPPESPLSLSSLRVELSREGRDSLALSAAVGELPERLRAALAAQGVTVEEVQVTVGASALASTEALTHGGVDVALLSAAEFAALETDAVALLAAGEWAPDMGDDPADWNGDLADTSPMPGVPTLLCAAPTAYGKNLAGRENLTWAELDRARWGLLTQGALSGYQAVSLWLADGYDGNTAGDLTHAALYDSYEALLRAAAAEEIDLLALTVSARQTWAAAWTLDAARTDGQGAHGFGRTEALWTELPVLAVTPRLYETVAAVTPESVLYTDQRFAPALSAAISAVQDGGGQALGLTRYAPVENDALNPQRRLAVLAGA